MEFCSPGSKGHNRAVIVRSGADRRSLVDTGATNGIGTEHIASRNIEQVDLATKPAVRVIASESAHCRTVIGQSYPIHPKWIRPHEFDRASISVKDIQCRILSHGIADNSRNS